MLPTETEFLLPHQCFLFGHTLVEPCRKIYILHLFSDIPVLVLVLDILAKTLALLETTGHLEVGNGCHRQDRRRFFGTT